MQKLLECYKKEIILKKGEKCELIDISNNKYLDMYAGICVTNLGHNPDGLEKLVSNLSKELIHTSNYFYNENEINLALTLNKLISPSIDNAKIFFCNSGTEANEGALKFAILQTPGNILAFSGSFHGRTLGSLSCTHNINYRERFSDYLNNRVYFWDWNVTEGLDEFIKTNNITIVIHEVIQGEGGVRKMTDEMINLLTELHNELKFSWIVDEVQTGIGRCGEVFVHQKYNIRPDFVTIAKALGNGIPIGAVICNSNTKISPGLHGNTFGGNSFTTGVSNWVLNKIGNLEFLNSVNEKGNYLIEKLQEIALPEYIKEIRGEGLLIGLEFCEVISVYDVIKELKKMSILSISAANNTLRICPPLIISKEEIDVFITKLKIILENMKSFDNEKKKNKKIVWKISGDIKDDDLKNLLDRFQIWKNDGYDIALLFGAGTHINNEILKHNLKPEYFEGQRKTTKEIIPIIFKVVQEQQARIISIANQHTKLDFEFIQTPVFSAATDLMETHGYVVEPTLLEKEYITKIWDNNKIPLIHFMSIYNNELYNSNSDIGLSCLSLCLDATISGYSVGHEFDINKFNFKNINIEQINNKIIKQEFTEGFRLKIKEVNKIFDSNNEVNNEKICYIGTNDNLPINFSEKNMSGIIITKCKKYNIGLIGSRGFIGSEISKYVNNDDNMHLIKFSLMSDTTFTCENHEPIIKLNSFSEINNFHNIDLWISSCPNNVLKNNIHTINKDIPIIDVSSDFRHEPGWEYGFCYLNKNLSSKRISNPGCYSSAAICALFPLLKINKNITAHITGISSCSGSGKQHHDKFPDLHDTLISYQHFQHYQQGEIQKFLNIPIYFIPIVTDQFDRGIVCTIQVTSEKEWNLTELKKTYFDIYNNHQNIKCYWNENEIITTNAISRTTNIILSNFKLSEDKKVLHIQSMIDNLSIGGGYSTYLNVCNFFGLNNKNENNSKSINEKWVNNFESYNNYLNNIHFPLGFTANNTNVPFVAKEINKKKVLQLTCLKMSVPCKWTAVYTKNPVCGNPVKIGRKRLEQNKPIKALIINNKISNVGYDEGYDDAEDICDALAKKNNCEKDEVIPVSTGVIGWRLPKEEIVNNIYNCITGGASVLEMARSIMTTDTYPKCFCETLSNGATIVGIAKGAGMVEPNMATTLIFILTDADCDNDYMKYMLKQVVDETFNCISIDGDTSTSDSCFFISSSLKPKVSNGEMIMKIKSVCSFLAKQLVWNGEGIQHCIEVVVSGAPDTVIAKKIGKNIANSTLVKCAINGNDPNIGRIVGAMAREVENVDWSLVDVFIGSQCIYNNGNIVNMNVDIENKIYKYLKKCEIYDKKKCEKPNYPVHDHSVVIQVKLNQGEKTLTVYGGDLSDEYVKINSDYRS